MCRNFRGRAVTSHMQCSDLAPNAFPETPEHHSTCWNVGGVATTFFFNWLKIIKFPAFSYLAEKMLLDSRIRGSSFYFIVLEYFIQEINLKEVLFFVDVFCGLIFHMKLFNTCNLVCFQWFWNFSLHYMCKYWDSCSMYVIIL
jgi:hypothetical protein